MKAALCPRSYEVEALRDGRLTGFARENFERHLGVCRDCTREAEALQALALPLRLASADDSLVDELHVRRERTRLLSAFDSSRVTPERPSRRSLGPALMVAVGIVAVLFAGWHLRPSAPRSLEARATVKTQGPAVWSRHLDPNTERLILDSGSLEIQVRPSLDQRRFLVVLPDGELEDIGTTFTVVVKDNRTTKVTVQEGSVVLRLRERSAITIGAGEVWADAPAPPAATPRVSAPESEPVPSAREPVSRPREPSPSSAAPPEERSPSPRPPSVASAASTADPSLDFRSATALLGSGDNVGAAAALAAFLGKYPRDPRSEDAAYLRIIALQRAGDVSGTERAATEYLRRYPSGFRRAEAERLAH